MDDIFSQIGMWLLAVTLHHNCLKITKPKCVASLHVMCVHERNVCLLIKKHHLSLEIVAFKLGKSQIYEYICVNISAHLSRIWCTLQQV